MEIWLDSIDDDLIKLGNSLGILTGISTNPNLIASSEKNLESILTPLLKLQNGPIAVQITATTSTQIIEQAEHLADFSERIIVKVPVTQEGLKATTTLSRLRIPIMAVSIFTPSQALFACQAGAQYIAVNYTPIQKEGSNPSELTGSIQYMINRYDFETKTLSSFLKEPSDMFDSLDLGIDGVTLEKECFEKLIENNDSTLREQETFLKEWQQAKPSRLLP